MSLTMTHPQVPEEQRWPRRPVGARVCCQCGVTEPAFPLVTTRGATLRLAALAPVDMTRGEAWVDVCTACLRDAHRACDAAYRRRTRRDPLAAHRAAER